MKRTVTLRGRGPFTAQRRRARKVERKARTRMKATKRVTQSPPNPRKERLRGYARRMREHPTAAEALLWQCLTEHELGGHFRRQHPLCGYIADFYAKRERLVVEVDGSSHAGREEYDGRRDRRMRGAKIRVVRFTNEVVLRDPDAVVGEISRLLETDTGFVPRLAGASEGVEAECECGPSQPDRPGTRNGNTATPERDGSDQSQTSFDLPPSYHHDGAEDGSLAEQSPSYATC